MARRDMKGALGASLRAEEEAVEDRFARADSIMTRGPSPSHTEETPPRVIRDSFTMPASDYDRIAQLRQRCLRRQVSATKAEVLRAALAALSALSDEELLQVVASLPKVKTGRPTSNNHTV